MKINELIKLLKKSGCYIERHGANHDIWFSPKTGNYFQVGRHKSQEIRVKTLESIKKSAGI
ncbi:MAG: type II toxin-antitoxin system HicA family toxin [Bacteroidaceae bacterium]|nr:type II toxin-antitoxin system HicA family toxin [Bacteroidaceae bacterium]